MSHRCLVCLQGSLVGLVEAVRSVRETDEPGDPVALGIADRLYLPDGEILVALGEDVHQSTEGFKAISTMTPTSWRTSSSASSRRVRSIFSRAFSAIASATGPWSASAISRASSIGRK